MFISVYMFMLIYKKNALKQLSKKGKFLWSTYLRICFDKNKIASL